jgi:hypothetical protein
LGKSWPWSHHVLAMTIERTITKGFFFFTMGYFPPINWGVSWKKQGARVKKRKKVNPGTISPVSWYSVTVPILNNNEIIKWKPYSW